MPTPITPVSAWTALEQPAGTDVANRASIDNALQRLANRIEFLKDIALGGVTSWPVVGVVRALGLAAAVPDNTGGIGWFNTQPFWTATTYDAEKLMVSASEYLKTGETITQFDAFLKPGAARSGTNRVKIELCYVTQDYLTPTNAAVVTVIGSQSDDTTANKQRAVSSVLSHVVDRTVNDYFFRVTSGATASSFSDQLHALRLFVSRPSVG